MDMIEGCAVADSGLIYLPGFSTLEGDSYLICTEYGELKKITARLIWDAPMRRIN